MTDTGLQPDTTSDRRNRRWRRRLLAGATAVVLLGAGCGDDGGGGSSSGDSVEDRYPTQIERGDRKVDRDATLRFGHFGALDSLDPLHFDAIFGESTPVYDTLLRQSRTKVGEVEGALAESWTYSADGKNIDLRIRKGVTFHDGEPLTPEAVKMNLERVIKTPLLAAQSNVRNLTGVEVVGDQTVRVTGSTPIIGLHNTMTSVARWTAIISPKLLGGGDLVKNASGTGPYRLVSFEAASKAVFERFDGYWDGPEHAGVKRLEFHYLPDEQTRLNALRTNQIDGTILSAKSAESAQQAGLQVITGKGNSVILLLPNRTKSEFDDVKVRQALSHALDREALCKAIFFGFCQASSQGFLEEWPQFEDARGHNAYAYDPQRAKQLLAEAGVPNGFSFGITFTTTDPYPQLGELVQAQLGAVGIQAKLQPVEPAQLAAVYLQVDSIFGGAFGVDPALALAQRYSAKGTANLTQQSPPELQSIIDKLAAETDAAERERLLGDAGKIVLDQALDFPILWPNLVFAFNNRVIEWDTTRASTFDPVLTHLTMGS